MRYAERTTPNTLNPYQMHKERGVTERLYSLLYQGLVLYDPEIEQSVSRLASHWEPEQGVTESLTFHIREGAMWHDGTPVTARDVEVTYNKLLNNIKVQNTETVETVRSIVEKVTRLGNTVIKFDLVRSTDVSTALQYFEQWIVPAHAFNPETGLENSLNNSYLSDLAIGTGPFAMRKKKSANGNVQMTSFDRTGTWEYWGDVPNLSEIEMYVEPDPFSRVQSALAGSAELIIDVPVSQVDRIQNESGWTVKKYANDSFISLAVNLSNAKLANVKVRQAMMHAMDRLGLLKTHYQGRGTILHAPMVPGTPFSTNDVVRYDHDVDKAKGLLAEAGFSIIGSSGIRQNAAGERLEFTMISFVDGAATETTRSNVLDTIVNELEDVGIRVNVEPLDFPVYIERLRSSREYDLAWWAPSFDSSYNITKFFHSNYNAKGQPNFVGYQNNLVDRYLDEFNAATDPLSRTSNMAAVLKELSQDLPYLYLLSIDKYYATHVNLAVPKVHPFYFFSFVEVWSKF
ncbi:MAG: ABC transporter substrate-binding protein [Rhodothermales bacterium]